ncbi:MAG: hypothetical protein HY709_04900 [Candidatus Latescibacteria bacterium]|nr:hypothetical protein [Candidatus Latescibacterota bacterium]
MSTVLMSTVVTAPSKPAPRPPSDLRTLGVSLEQIEREFEQVIERLATRIPSGLYEQLDDPELCLRIDRAEEAIDRHAKRSRTVPVEGKAWKKTLRDYELSWMAAMRYIVEGGRNHR